LANEEELAELIEPGSWWVGLDLLGVDEYSDCGSKQ